MEILLQGVEIFYPQSDLHGQQRNLLIKEGKIAAISEQDIQSAGEKLDCRGLKLSIGWFDMMALFGEPGFEYKEDLESGKQAAAAGGFTELALWPNTKPVIQTKNDLRYITSQNQDSLVKLHPVAAITKDAEGKELTEMIDLHTGGAVAFSDGIEPLWNTDIVVKTLQYLQKFDGLLITRPEDKLLTQFGTMNEGLSSTMMGLRGMPTLAEELVIDRDLKLLEYAGGKIHFSQVSSARSVELIRKAKHLGLNVSCDVAAHQLFFDDSLLKDFDTNYKVNPPLRGTEDIEALLNGVEDGTIDVIVSGHIPQDQESKKLEFDYAEFGMLGLQTVMPILNQISKRISWEKLIEKLTVNPRKLLNLPLPEIKEGKEANLTLFDPKKSWKYDKSTNYSKSSNSPLLGQELEGAVVGVFHDVQHWFNK
jgi:dihydroorotase